MSKSDDAIGFDRNGNPFMLGDEVIDNQERIINDERSKPILIVAELDGDLGVRVFGPPSLEMADTLDHIARTYRIATEAALKKES